MKVSIYPFWFRKVQEPIFSLKTPALLWKVGEVRWLSLPLKKTKAGVECSHDASKFPRFFSLANLLPIFSHGPGSVPSHFIFSVYLHDLPSPTVASLPAPSNPFWFPSLLFLRSLHSPPSFHLPIFPSFPPFLPFLLSTNYFECL